MCFEGCNIYVFVGVDIECTCSHGCICSWYCVWFRYIINYHSINILHIQITKRTVLSMAILMITDSHYNIKSLKTTEYVFIKVYACQ